jgi:hypothetical protein
LHGIGGKNEKPSSILSKCDRHLWLRLERVAGNADCPWNSLSDATKERFALAYENGTLTAPRPPITSLDLQKITNTCVRPGGSLRAAVATLILHVKRDDLQREMMRMSLNPSDLDLSWMRLGPLDRERFKRAYPGPNARNPDAQSNVIIGWMFSSPSVRYAIAQNGQAEQTHELVISYLEMDGTIEDMAAQF